MKVVIVGAGISGLACAHRLAALAGARRGAVDLTVLESSRRPGGVIATETRDGFLLEGGPDCFVSDRPWALDLCRRLGLEGEIIGTNPAWRRSFILRKGRTEPVPDGYQLLAPSKLLPFLATSILSPTGKARVACDLFLPRGPECADESLASFVRRRFGTEALERLAQPLLAGIYDADPERLSLRATMPRFLEMERTHRSVILALLRERRAGRTGTGDGVSGARYSLFVTLRNGLQGLVDRLAAALPHGTLRLGAHVSGLERSRQAPATGRGDGPLWRVSTVAGEAFAADAVVLALPACAAVPLLRGVDDSLAALMSEIPYGSSATVSLAYRREDVPHRLDGFGFVVPRAEGRTLVACTFSSVKFAGRAPAGSALLRAFVGGAAGGTEGTGLLEQQVRDDLRQALGITAPPMFTRVFIHPRSMAQYEVGHLDRVAAITARLGAQPGLALAGNGLRGVGIPDCVWSGEQAAEGIWAQAGVV
jgi:protoporphyrinogen/coproporphyrinogen III oxidase